MSYDRFKEFANRTGKDEEERKLIEEALKATKEGRESDMWRYNDR